jgi:hypothetical protein
MVSGAGEATRKLYCLRCIPGDSFDGASAFYLLYIYRGHAGFLVLTATLGGCSLQPQLELGFVRSVTSHILSTTVTASRSLSILTWSSCRKSSSTWTASQARAPIDMASIAGQSLAGSAVPLKVLPGTPTAVTEKGRISEILGLSRG